MTIFRKGKVSVSAACRRLGMNDLILLVIFAVLYVVAAMIKPSVFLTSDSFKSMSYQIAGIGIMSFGMLVCMLSGGIDLSVVGIHNLVGMTVGLYVTSVFPAEANFGTTAILMLSAVLLALLVGLSCGMLNGILISRVGIPPILATMGTGQLFLGICLIVKKGSAVSGLSGVFVETVNLELGGIVPLHILVFAGCLLVVSRILRKTQYGLKLYMLGSNRTASKYAGLNNNLILIKTYILSGLLCSVAGILTLARNNSSRADYGPTLTMQAILICVLGGVNPNGGSGKIFGTVIAILILQVFSTGLNMLRDMNAFMRDAMWGVILVMVMIFNFYSERKQARA